MISSLSSTFYTELASYVLGAGSVFASLLAIKRKLGIEILTPEAQEIFKEFKKDLLSIRITFRNTRAEISQARKMNSEDMIQLYELYKCVDPEKLLEVLQLAQEYRGKDLNQKTAAEIGVSLSKIYSK